MLHRGAAILFWGLFACTPSGSAGAPSTSREADTLSRSSWAAFQTEHLPKLRGLRWALFLHRPTHTLADSLLAAGATLSVIYVPEHGLLGEKAAGQSVADTTYRGIPVRSLYGRQKAPSPKDLEAVDAILFALRDVGVRHYTYLSTLAYLLRAAHEANRPVWLLDFPNPHAHYAYGPLLDSSLFSFVGLHPTPLVPGLTIGEYALLLTGEGWVSPAALTVVPWVAGAAPSPYQTRHRFYRPPLTRPTQYPSH